MIIFFGPAGAGKSIQGQILAARQGWRWLSMGQLLRDTRDTETFSIMQKGELVSDDKIYGIVSNALNNVANINNVILDGFPRQLEQARWLIDNQLPNGYSIDLVVVLDVPKDELMKRLELRGRADDTSQAIDERLQTYQNEMSPILDYFNEKNVNIAHVDGVGTVGQVHDRIIEELAACKLV